MVSLSMRLLGYSKIHTVHNILISGKLRYLATLWSQRCEISQLLLYSHLVLNVSSLFLKMRHSV